MTTVNDLDNFLKRFSLYPAIDVVGRQSIKLFEQNIPFENISVRIGNVQEHQTVTQWGCAFIAYRLIIAASDKNRINFNIPQLLTAQRIFNDLDEPFIHDKDILGFLGRVSQEQFWYQEHVRHLFSRHYFLLVVVPKQLNKQLPVDLNSVFKKQFNLSLQDFLAIGWCTFGLLQKSNPYFKEEQLINTSVQSLKKFLTKDKVASFLKCSAASYQMIKNSDREINRIVLPTYEKYKFNPIFKFPIIQVPALLEYSSQSHFVIPNIMLLLKRVSEGVYWELRDLFKKDQSREFLKTFGMIFEAYVGIILKRYFGEKNVINLNKIVRKEQEKTADWLIVNGDTALLIECKSSLLPYVIKQTFNKSLLKGWCSEVLCDGLKQLFSAERLLKTGKLKINAIKQPIKRFYKVLVTYQNLYFPEAPEWKSLLEEILSDDKKGNGIYLKSDKKFYVMSVEELELMESIISKFNLEKIFIRKEELDKEVDLRKGRDFLYLFREMNGNKELDNKWLNSIFNDYFKNLVPALTERIDPKFKKQA